MRWSFRSPAKINPHLAVVGRRTDGFHELKLLFQTLDLHDVLHFESSAHGFALADVQLSDALAGSTLSRSDDNLIVRAGQAFERRWGLPGGFRVRLEKSIPLGGGLGGGSSNAGTTLLALREICGRPAAVSDLWPVARELGADVPYFLLGGLAAGFGRGDELVALEDGPAEDLILAMPRESISTAQVFGDFASRDMAAAAGWPAALARWVLDGRDGESLRRLEGWNDLQPVVLERSRTVAAVYAALHRQGVEGVRMTGSGACLFGYLPSADHGLPDLSPDLGSIRRVRTLPRRSLGDFRRAG